MVKVKKSKVISARTVSHFGVYAKSEWYALRRYRSWLYQNTRRLWTLSVDNTPVCVIGLKHNSLIGTGTEIYFMLCSKFPKHAREVIKFMRRGMRRLLRLHPVLTVKVDENFWIGEKFIQFFGFQCAGLVHGINGIKYKHYELRASWL